MSVGIHGSKDVGAYGCTLHRMSVLVMRIVFECSYARRYAVLCVGIMVWRELCG